MKLLLDTHVFLWAVGNKQLSKAAASAFLDPENTLHLSAASYWEISIKLSLGKLDLMPSWQVRFDQEIAANQIQWLEITKQHCWQVSVLPFLHGDPFDRLLIAQAQIEGMTLMSADSQIQRYSVPILW